MAKITRTQQRWLVASSIAFFLAAAIIMPTPSDARGGGGHGSGGHRIGSFGFAHRHVIVARPGFFVALRSFPHENFSHRQFAFHHSHAIGSQFFSLGTDGAWAENFVTTPTILVAQQPGLADEPARHRSVMRTPDPEQQGILVVRGTSKAYVTFPSGKPG